MAALNRPRDGNMDGINSINYECYREVGWDVFLPVRPGGPSEIFY